jgi:hypothetical protein
VSPCAGARRTAATARTLAFLVAAALGLGASWPARAARPRCDDRWELAVPEPSPHAPTTLGAISGIVALGPERWLVVHDAKRALDPPGGPPATRLRLVERAADGSLTRTVVAWPGAQANDLEALARLPGTACDVLAVESGEETGRVTWYQLRLAGATVGVVASGTLTGEPPQVEGFALASIAGRPRALWAGRGSGLSPARLRCGDVVLDAAGTVAAIAPAPGHADVFAPDVPRSDPNVRHVADLVIAADGTVWATATIDPGNAGPFRSVVYAAGRLHDAFRFPAFTPCARPRSWCSVPFHKVEGLALTPRGPLLASDDELLGGWLRLP